VLSGANRHDMKKLGELLDAPVLSAPAAEVAKRHLCLDWGYAYPVCRRTAAEKGYTPHIPPKTSEQAPLPAPGDPDRHPARRR
jgi:hypothetical protein